jgi:Ran GTPase-activating protein (RanGAP) involved in mRNA processing and transport
MKNNALQFINLRENRLIDTGGLAIARIIQHKVKNKLNCPSLDISKNRISNVSMLAILNALSNNEYEYIKLNSSGLIEPASLKQKPKKRTSIVMKFMDLRTNLLDIHFSRLLKEVLGNYVELFRLTEYRWQEGMEAYDGKQHVDKMLTVY